MDIVIRFIADWLLIIIAIISSLALLTMTPKNDRYMRYVRIGMAGVTVYVSAKITAFFFQPEAMRPFEKLGIDPGAAFLNNPGFPSDHALFAVFLTVAVYFATRNKLLLLCLSVATIIMCIGRVLALVHTPLDVIGGAFIALVGSIWYMGIDKMSKM